jgi:threonine aldolase
LQDGAWLRHAAHANAMAQRLEFSLCKLPPIKAVFPCQTNGAFVKMPAAVIKGMHALGWKFHTHVNPEDCRLMCSWDTTTGDVDSFAADVKSLLANG